mmetsp:Transcript_13956/g.15524  ORF Transcript_13956/g.15524 Transcript_13956/m.15524 type:complete len:481 (+) Transcript_13956:139-1581(+)
MNSTKNTTTIISTFNSSWRVLLEMDQPLDFKTFLQSNLLTSTRNTITIFGIIRMIGGATSTIASIALIVHILRTEEGVCSPKAYHRLIFGLSVADVLSSLWFSLGPTMLPNDINYIVKYAIGNETTCSLQGFFIHFGSAAALLYNCSLCFYYLAIIKYNKNNEYIQKKLEPWFHAVSILIPFILCFLIKYGFHAYKGGQCIPNVSIQQLPPHCIGHGGETIDGFSIPCKDSTFNFGTASDIAAVFYVLVTFLITPSIIVGSMVSMYRFVSRIEQRMSRYGENTLNVNNQIPKESNPSGKAAESNNERKMSLFFLCPSRSNHQKNGDDRHAAMQRRSSSSNRSSTKREVFHRAMGYAMAWGIIWIPWLAGAVLSGISKPEEPVFILANLLLSALTPLQGLANFIVFMSPKVRATKFRRIHGSSVDLRENNGENSRINNNVTWFQAFIKAYMSKGSDGNKRSARLSGSRNSRNLGSTSGDRS